MLSVKTQPTPLAADLQCTLEEAHIIAKGIGKKVNTSHILLALFTVPTAAAILLKDRNIDDKKLLRLLSAEEMEDSAAVGQLLRIAEETAIRYDAPQIHTLHLLNAFLKDRKSIAYKLLEKSLKEHASFRNLLLSYLSGVMPRRLLASIQEAKQQKKHKRKKQTAKNLDKSLEQKIPERKKYKRHKRPSQSNPKDEWLVPKSTFIDGKKNSEKNSKKEKADHKKSDEQTRTKAHKTQIRINKIVEEDIFTSISEIPEQSFNSPLSSELEEDFKNEVQHKNFYQISRAPTLLPTAYDLDESLFPWLCSLGRNLSSLAEYGELDPAIGRDVEIEQIADVLGKRRANNPCLVGEAGVGKTAIAEGLAVKLITGDPSVSSLQGKVIIELDMSRITAGTALRGSFSERMQGLKKDVERAKGRVIIFIDEIHTLMGAGASGDSPQDGANELKSALARGAFPCIGSTTLDEYHKFIEEDPAMERRFVKILIEEPTDEEALLMLKGVAPIYEKYHGLKCQEDAIYATVQLSSRFIHDRKLPGKAIDLLDLSMSRAKRHGIKLLQREQVATICSDIAKIPLDRILLEDAGRFLKMEDILQRSIIGHTSVIKTVSESIRRSYAGFNHNRPLGIFLFLGPSGVGKTEMAKSIADFIYADQKALIQIDMSEYAESHTLAKLIGAPPGYVGHHEGGQLTEAVRKRPHAIILLDEIEKAHVDVLPVMLQVLDEGRLTDNRGRQITFKHCVIVMTSNAGANIFHKQKNVGFSNATNKASNTGQNQIADKDVLKKAKVFFAPELWGRIEDKCVFHPLNQEQLANIARILLKKTLKSLYTSRNIKFGFADTIPAFLVKHSDCDESNGARPLRQSIRKWIEAPISKAILHKELKEGLRYTIKLDTQGQIRFL